VSGLAALFDEVSILSAGDPEHRHAVLGPFAVEEYKAGAYVRLRRNAHYWKRDAQGRQLPYLESVRLDIQRNEQIELQRFRRGEFQIMSSLSAEAFEYLNRTSAGAQDAGPSLDVEFLWFNQTPSAPIAEYKKRWFQSQPFRLAVSEAINRDDLCRIAYNGRATPAAAITSPANRRWFNSSLKPRRHDPAAALARLQKAGFKKQGNTLVDAQGNVVEFSLITNSGNKSRERMAAMMQQDLAKIGIRLNIVALDFQSLIGRIGRTLDYEASLLGLVGVDLDPSAQMNVWLSSASNHPWNPKQEKPATAWEAEIDRLMQAQAAAQLDTERKKLFDQVQQIAFDQAPLVYLVHRNTLFAVSPKLRNINPGLLWPQVFWNVDELRMDTEISQSNTIE
jgi:peptide/nickel transport system substrate-binding protein